MTDFSPSCAGDERSRHRLFVFLCFVGFAGFFGSYLRIPILPLLAAAVGGGAAQVGMVNAAFMLAAGLFSIPAGMLADRVGRRATAVAGLLALALSSFAIAACTSTLQMALVYLLFGAGLAAFAPAMMSFVAEAAPPGGLGRAYGWYTTAVYTAMTFGPAVGGFVGKHLGLRQVFVLSGIIVLAVFAAAFAFLPRGSGGHHARGAVAIALRRCLESRTLVATLLATVGSCFGFGLFLTFLPLHAREHGLDPAAIGGVFACQAVVNVLSRIPFGKMVDRAADRRLPVAVGFFVVAAGVALLGAAGSLIPLCACATLIGIGMAVGYTAVGALVADSVPGELRGLAMGMYNSSIYLGMMSGSALIGPVARHFGFGAAFGAGGGVTAVVTLLFLRLSPSPVRTR